MLTQVAYVGFTSDGLGFYFADLTMNSRLWIVLIAEHVLLLIKVSVTARSLQLFCPLVLYRLS